MKFLKSKKMTWIFCILVFSFAMAALAQTREEKPKTTDLEEPVQLDSTQGVITILGTNDMHGSFERFPWFAGYVAAIRKGLKRQYGDRGVLLLLDGGDAAQGTLISNYSEGDLAARLMNTIGYSAAVLGNHAFDFGPKDWTKDKCSKKDSSCDPLETVRSFSNLTQSVFPILAANITQNNKPVEFLKSYQLVEFRERKIAIIGLDNPKTPSTTIKENVESLKFGDGINEVKQIVDTLSQKNEADIFVLVMHEGDDGKDNNMQKFIQTLGNRDNGMPYLDAIVAAHTHQLNENTVNQVPYIQSMANGERFGLIQLVVTLDQKTGRWVVNREKTRKKAGIEIKTEPNTFFGEEVEPNVEVQSILDQARKVVDAIAQKKIGLAQGVFDRAGARISDSVLGNLIADLMRESSGAEVSLINSGDLRDDLPEGELVFENLFKTIPKNLRLQTVTEMPSKMFYDNLMLSARTCQVRGALQISGFKLVFQRKCLPSSGEDPQAKILKIVLDSGEIFYNFKKNEFSRQTINVATTDFVMTGGAGYKAFLPISEQFDTDTDLKQAIIPIIKNKSPLNPKEFSTGRYINCKDTHFISSPDCL